MKYSASNINKFFKCPFFFKLCYIDKIKMVEVSNPKRDLGFNMHQIIHEYYKLIGKQPTAEMVKNVAKSCFARYFDDSLKNLLPEAEELLKNFIQFELSRLTKYTAPIMLEQKLEDEQFNGIIDFFDGNKIIDWKTGKMLTLGDDECIQGKIYNHLLNSNGYAGNFKVYFVTLANGRCLEMPATTEQWLMQKTQKMFSMIQAQQFPKVKSGLCSYCNGMLDCQCSDLTLWGNVSW